MISRQMPIFKEFKSDDKINYYFRKPTEPLILSKPFKSSDNGKDDEEEQDGNKDANEGI